MDLREKLILDQKVKYGEESICKNCFHHGICRGENNQPCFECNRFVDANGVTVQEWISSEEKLPEFPCLAIDANGNSAFIPDGIITIKDKHGEWCLNASLSKEVRLIDGTKIDAAIWENRIAYWMPLPEPPKGD